MNEVVTEFIETLSPKVKDTLRGTAIVHIEGEGFVLLSDQGAELADEDTQADVKLISNETVFRNILDGSQNPAMAFMSGKLKVDGSNMRALKVAEILTAS